MWS
ncbi:unnamed protein product [Gulo gulo]|jgi:hypothetical protein